MAWINRSILVNRWFYELASANHKCRAKSASFAEARFVRGLGIFSLFFDKHAAEMWRQLGKFAGMAYKTLVAQSKERAAVAPVR